MAAKHSQSDSGFRSSDLGSRIIDTRFDPPGPRSPIRNPQSEIGNRKWSRGDFVVLVLAVGVLVLFRLHAFTAPLEVDECNYAYFGQRLLAGDNLYTDLWDHQPPGVFAFTAVLVALFGSSPLVFRIASAVAAAVTLVVVYGLCKQALSAKACWLAAAAFALASSDPGIAGEGCNREVYMNLLGAGGLWLILARRWWALLAAGLCLGVSSLFKTVAAAQWLFLFVAVVASEVRGPTPRVLAGLRAALLFATGPVLVWACTFAYFQATQRLEVFVEAAFSYNLTYGRFDAPLWEKFTGFFSRGMAGSVFRSAAVLWLAGGLGTLLLPWRRNFRFSSTMAAFALGSFVAVCLPGWFWRHYYMLLLPSLVLGSAVIFDRLWRRRCVAAGDRAHLKAWKIGAYAYAGVVLLGLLGLQFVFYLSREPVNLSSPRYSLRMAWARQQGLRTRAVTAPDDAVCVWGMDVGIYYYAQRRSASRYTLIAPLQQDSASAAQRRARFAEDLARTQPRLIMLTSAKPIPELDQFIRERGYIWVGQDEDRMVVLCDPDKPIEAIDWTFKNGE